MMKKRKRILIFFVVIVLGLIAFFWNRFQHKDPTNVASIPSSRSPSIAHPRPSGLPEGTLRNDPTPETVNLATSLTPLRLNDSAIRYLKTGGGSGGQTLFFGGFPMLDLPLVRVLNLPPNHAEELAAIIDYTIKTLASRQGESVKHGVNFRGEEGAVVSLDPKEADELKENVRQKMRLILEDEHADILVNELGGDPLIAEYGKSPLIVTMTRVDGFKHINQPRWMLRYEVKKNPTDPKGFTTGQLATNALMDLRFPFLRQEGVDYSQ